MNENNFGMWLAVVIIVSFTLILVGCAEMKPKVKETDEVNTGGVVGSAEINAVKAELKAEGNRIVGVQKEIQQNTYNRIDAQGDVVMFAAAGSGSAVLMWLMQTVQEMWRDWLNRPDRPRKPTDNP